MSVATAKPVSQGARVLSYAGALLETMDAALADHPNAFIMGQGVDDFKGIFGSTTGLAEKYGAARVFDTPLMEEGMTGVAIGAALVGDYPITTHIRADFSFLAMNQIINLASKYRYMFGGLMSCPMLIRIVVGRSWGQGAQHSQSPQATFAHYPGLTVVMPSSSQAILDMYPAIINRHPGPVISIEHRLLYNLDFTVSPSDKRVPLTSYVAREGSDVTVVATSVMVLEALRAAQYVQDEAGISAEIIDLNSISHPDWDLVAASVRQDRAPGDRRHVVAGVRRRRRSLPAAGRCAIRACCASRRPCSAWRRRRARPPRAWKTSTIRASTRRWTPS